MQINCNFVGPDSKLCELYCFIAWWVSRYEIYGFMEFHISGTISLNWILKTVLEEKEEKKYIENKFNSIMNIKQK